MNNWLEQYLNFINTSPFGNYEIQEVNPYLNVIENAFANDFDIYGYQGINQDIISALNNVFGSSDNPPGAILNFPGTEETGGFPGDPVTYLNITDVFDPESIATSLSYIMDVSPGTESAIKAAEVKALTPEMIEKTTSEYYSPYEESERQSLVEKLGAAIGKAQTGGFAGSGARQSGLSGAERLYRGGYGDILSDIMKMRAKATGDVLDTIYGYQELLDQTG